MLWIWKEKILSGSDQGEACQRRRDFNLDGICGDVRRENPEAPPPLFCHDFYLVLHPPMVTHPLEGAHKHLAA